MYASIDNISYDDCILCIINGVCNYVFLLDLSLPLPHSKPASYLRCNNLSKHVCGLPPALLDPPRKMCVAIPGSAKDGTVPTVWFQTWLLFYRMHTALEFRWPSVIHFLPFHSLLSPPPPAGVARTWSCRVRMRRRWRTGPVITSSSRSTLTHRWPSPSTTKRWKNSTAECQCKIWARLMFIFLWTCGSNSMLLLWHLYSVITESINNVFMILIV